MNIDKPQCNFKNCRYCFDGNCASADKYENCKLTDLHCEIAKLTVDLDNAKSEWISVDERLPKYNTSVLVYRPTMAMPIVADTYYGWYGEDDERWYEGWSLYGKNLKGENVITHWMPLPEPPKGD